MIFFVTYFRLRGNDDSSENTFHLPCALTCHTEDLPVILPIFPSKSVPTKPATCAPRLTPMKWKDCSLHPCVCWTRQSQILVIVTSCCRVFVFIKKSKMKTVNSNISESCTSRRISISTSTPPVERLLAQGFHYSNIFLQLQYTISSNLNNEVLKTRFSSI